MADWRKGATLKDVPRQYREAAEIMGMEPFLAMCENYGGFEVYFPKLDAVWREIRNRDIRQRYRNGESARHIGGLYGLKCRQVQDIIKRK